MNEPTTFETDEPALSERPDATGAGDAPAVGRPDGVAERRPEAVAALFDRCADRYDRVNTLITFGLDRRWRRWAARQALAGTRLPNGSVGGQAWGATEPAMLDACAGTGLLALELARAGARVTAVDVSPGMLAVARARFVRAALAVDTVAADLTAPSSDADVRGPFAAVTLGFGLRYVAEPIALLVSLRARLAPGGRLVVLESVRPPGDPIGALAGRYFFAVAPRAGAALAGDDELYRLLASSTRAIGGVDQVVRLMREAGFAPIAQQRFAGGVVAGLVATAR